MRKAIVLLYKLMYSINLRMGCKVYSVIFRVLLWLNNVSFGHGLVCFRSIPNLHISKDAKKVSMGSNVVFNSYDGPSYDCKCSIYVKENAELVVGNNAGFNGVLIYTSNNILIGNNVKVGGGTMIFDTDFHPLNHMARRYGLEGTCSKPVIIADDVFIGAHCIIGKGVTIGERSILAAGSVVVKSIPPNEVWGGVQQNLLD